MYKEELKVFNKGPENNPSFIIFLRKYDFLLLFSAYLLYSLAIILFAENSLVSYLLVFIAFTNLIFYFIQFAVYTNNYVKDFLNAINSPVNKDVKSHIRSIMAFSNLKKLLILCTECAKVVIAAGCLLDIGYKMTHGGINVVPVWRQDWLNQIFPNDNTKVWTETKVATALHNLSMGDPYDFTDDSLIDEKKKKLFKE